MNGGESGAVNGWNAIHVNKHDFDVHRKFLFEVH